MASPGTFTEDADIPESGPIDWDTFIQDSTQSLVYWVSIEGFGPAISVAQAQSANADGRYRFCSQVPKFAESDVSGLWRPIMSVDPPDIMSERIVELGGFAQMGGLSFGLVDVDDFVAGVFAPDSRPVAILSEDVTSTAGVISVRGVSSVDSSSVLYVNGEAMYQTTAPATSSWGVSRGAIFTDATAHSRGDPVYHVSPYISGRVVELWVAPARATSYSSARLVGSFIVESLSWDDTTCVWQFNCRSEIAAFDTIVPPAPRQTTLSQNSDGVLDDGRTGTIRGSRSDREPLTHWDEDPIEVALLVDKEVMGGRYTSGDDVGVIAYRGVCRTAVDDPKSQIEMRQVMTSSVISSSFRFSPQPNPSTERDSGTWVETRHPLQILLCILLSAEDDDGAELTNFSTGQSNYSSLLPGYGVGVDSDAIDWDSWNDVIDRTSSFELPNVVYGGEITTMRDWADKNILRPLGVSIIVDNGKLFCMRPRVPLAGESVASLTFSDVLLKENTGEAGTPGLPAMSLSRVLTVPSEFGFSLGPEADSVGVARAATNGPGGTAVTVEVPGADPTETGFWAEEAAARVRQLYRPRTQLEVETSLKFWNVPLGSFIDITLNEVPDGGGIRGVINKIAWVRSREVRFDNGAYLRLTLDLFVNEALETRRIAPAARVTAVISNTATVQPNRYTSTNGFGGLPTTDASAFDVGDVVACRQISGVPRSGTQTVTAINGNDITLDGDFSGGLTAGDTIFTASITSAAASDVAIYAFTADDGLALDSGPPHLYGDG